jgi:hypothetical protein
MIVRSGPAVIACLLLVLAFLLEVALVTYPPRPIVFPLRTSQGAADGAPPHYVGLVLEVEPSQVQAAKVRMLRKVEGACSLLTRAEEEAQQAEAAIWQNATNIDEQVGANHEAQTWYIGIRETGEMIEKAKRAIGALGDHATLVEIKEAGRVTNECVFHVSATEREMESLKEFWQERAGRPPGGFRPFQAPHSAVMRPAGASRAQEGGRLNGGVRLHQERE